MSEKRFVSEADKAIAGLVAAAVACSAIAVVMSLLAILLAVF
jgi:hypothetical protein